MKSPFCVSFLFLVVFILPSSKVPAQQAGYVYHDCLNTTDYTANMDFLASLTSVLSSLRFASSVSKFYNISFGASSGRANGLFLCRGDLSTELCNSCVNGSIGDLQMLCPQHREAIVWYDVCMLRYSNESIFSHMEEEPSVSLYESANFTVSDLISLNMNLSVFMNRLVNRTVSSSNFYATQDMNVATSTRVYGLGQCTQDINESDCDLCLAGCANEIIKDYKGRKGGRVYRPSCMVEFESYPFYDSTPSVPLPSTPPSPPLSPAANDTSSSPPPSPPTNDTPPSPPPSPSADEILAPPPRTSTNSNDLRRKKKESRPWIAIGIAISVVIAFTAVLPSVFWCWWRRNIRDNEESRPGNDILNDILMREKQVESQELPLFALRLIQESTQQFSDENKLGEGGFGPVYKGILADGKQIAVKRLSRTSGQGLQEFKNEVTLIVKLQHKNLVRLLGCCLEGNELLLVYEYMPNKSLDFLLFDSRKSLQLDWKARIGIIIGIARGILYLHEDSRLKVIHRDLKASNILLDHEMNPKISDFGMARIFSGNQNEANTNRVVGTYGYMAPEYAMEGLFSIKSDVFSFGVLVLEILSGRKNSGFYLSDHGLSLLDYTWKLWCQGQALELMDPAIVHSCVPTEFLRYINIGLLCVQEESTDRPNMSAVVVMLASDNIELPQPAQPAFTVGRVVPKSAQPLCDGKVCSVNEVTLSNVSPR